MDSQLENPLSLSKETSAPEQFPFNKGYLSLPKSNDCSDDQKDRFLSNSFVSEMGPKSSLHGNVQFKLNKGYSQDSDISNNLGNIKMGEKSLTHSSDTPSEEPKFDEMRGLYKKSRPGLLAKKSEEIRRSNSMEEQKEPNSASSIPTKDENANSFVSDGGTVKKPAPKEYKKSSFVTKNPFTSKPAEKVSLTFDAFVDKFRGETPESIPSTYPSYKIDKRLQFVGKTVEYPWHVISYNSTFRKLWNFFIVIIIILQVFWYPIAAIFIYEQPWPNDIRILEKLSILVFITDIIINLRTTFTNENNEEIIDGKMMRRNYITNKLFAIDFLTTLPIPEILLATFDDNTPEGWAVYSISILVRMLRCFKITAYLQDRIMSIFFKLLRVFVTFFIMAHWVACIWYLILKLEFPAEPDVNNIWFPNNLRMVATGDQDLLFYYFGMDTIKVYGYTLLSVFMLMVGSDMAPLTDVQIWCSVFIGLFGQVALAYIFGLVTVTINRANEETMSHEQKLEELKHKIKVNKIPHNLRIKIMEFFNYSWRKHNVLKKTDDFSELSVPLQRDIALYQHQDMIIKVPLFQELEPIEVLSIVQKLKTSIYMPGDRIIREGEKGNEMFFIQEGLVEMMIKRVGLHRNKDQVGKWITQFERMILDQGDYFGEVALVSNSKRTFEARAYEFCILYTFSRNEYENLNNEFKNIGPRLRSGLRHYKNTRMKHVVHILKNLDIFRDFSDKELIIIGDKYLEEVFVDPEKLVLTPKNKVNALYIILSGNVNCYRDNEKIRKYLTHLKKSQNKDNWTVVDKNDLEEFDCIDDDILDMEKDKLSMEDQKKKLDLSEIFTYGEYFGALDFEVNETKCNEFYLSDSGCQILALTEALKLKMEAEHPKLYEKLRANLIDLGPKKVMMPIEEEEESSFTTKNNTKAKGPGSRRQSVFSDMSKRAAFARSPSLNKEEDVNVLKEELQKIRQELHNFKSLVSGLNLKLGSHNPKLKSREVSPSNAKRRSFTPMQISSQLNAMYKWSSVKELANGLLGVDEEDHGDETKT